MSPEQLKSMVGSELGCSDWFEVDQARIDDFARVTEDHNFIHVEPALAAATSFGSTIAHGLLTLSLIVHLCADFVPQLDNREMLLNYGFDKVRFVTPVRAGSRVRARASLASLTERHAGQWLVGMQVLIEIEGEARPALAAAWLSLHVLAQA